MAGLLVLWLAQGCGRCRITSGGIDKIRNNAGLKTHEQNEEHRHPMPGNRHTKRPDKSLGRSIAPRGSSRSNCQVKAILHGGIETGAEMRGKAQRQRGKAQRSGTERMRGRGHRGAEREGRREGLYVVISTSSPINDVTPSKVLPHLAGHMCNGGCFFVQPDGSRIKCAYRSFLCEHKRPICPFNP